MIVIKNNNSNYFIESERNLFLYFVFLIPTNSSEIVYLLCIGKDIIIMDLFISSHTKV